MRTDIQTVRARIDAAEQILADFRGERQHGLKTQRVDDYVVIDDGNDRWLAEQDEYFRTLESVISDILEGDYDHYLFSDYYGPADVSYEAYSQLCQDCDTIYSRCGHGSLLSIAALDVPECVKQDIVAALALEDEWADFLTNEVQD